MGSIGWGPKRIQSEVSASHYNDGRAKSHVGFVNPVHFLHATTPDDQRLNHIVDQAGQLDKEKLSKEVQSPFFEVRDGKIVSHEGRHRMSALARQGYTSVPVTIHHGKGSNLDPADSVTLQPQFKGRDPVTVSNLVPLHHDYDDQINDMMKQQPEHFQDGGDVDGITAYHGSPHDFDEFDTSKIGTGEGAQSYGHGLYFAGHEPVAKGYRDALSGDPISQEGVKPDWRDRGSKSFAQLALAQSMDKKLSGDDAIHDAMQDLHKNAGLTERKDIKQRYYDAVNSLGQMLGKEWDIHKGHMYEVHINAHPHHMLDWDKPLSEQSDHVQKALDSIQDHPDWTNGFKNELKRARGTNYFDGNDLYRELIKAKSAPEIAQMLHGFGIKGIKYLDAGSRGDKAEPTHNYVVFDHNDVRVKRKYEQGGAVDNDVIPHGDPKREQNLTKWHHGSHPLLKNKDGTPKTLYHGTQSDFSTFRKSQTGEFGPGIYSTDLPDEASDYAGTHPFAGKGPHVLPIHVRMKNPFVVDKSPDEFWNKFGGKTDEDAMFNAMAAGHDGIIFTRPYQFYDERSKQFVKTGQDHTHYVAFSPNQIKSATGNNGNFDPSNPDITKADGGEVDDHYIGEHYQDGGEVDPPKKKVKAYKLFRTDPKKPGKLFPLFVDANTPVPIKKWVEAKAGDPGKDPTKVKSKLGDLAYRPGWHAGDLPVATHIGGKSSSDLKAPDYRPDNHVWAEIEMPNDVDWQSEANSRVQYTKAGKPKPATAHITDQVPLGGHYRYKTNPNMTGNWLIGGSMKVNRILKDDEVKAINDANGVADLPRLPRAPETKARGGPIATSGPIVKRALELLSKDRTGR